MRSVRQKPKNEGWKLVRQRYDDGGFSGGTLKRPALEQLLIDIEAGQVNVVVVYKVDRLTRSLTDFAKIVEVFDNAGASFVAVTQHFNTTTSMGRLTLNVLLSFAQFEREVTGERIRDKIAASKRKGMWMGGAPPLGYNLKDRKLRVNEEEAKVVRLIFNRYLEIEDVSTLRNELRERGIKSKRWTSERGVQHGGKDFGRGALYRILRNRLYLGQDTPQRQRVRWRHGAIVSLETWDAIQQVLDSKQRRSGSTKSTRGHYLLRGILFDARGNQMHGTFTQKKNSKRYRYYVSAPLMGHGDKGDQSLLRISAQAIEDIVEDRVRTLLAFPRNHR